MEILGNGLFISLRVDFAFVNKNFFFEIVIKIQQIFYEKNTTNPCFKFKIAEKKVTGKILNIA